MSVTASLVKPLTVGDEVAHVAPSSTWRTLCRWPPDAFGATGTILGDSGTYRFVVCPPVGTSWPPADDMCEGVPWERSVRQWGSEWAQWAATHGDPRDGDSLEPPEAVGRLCSILDAAADTPISELDAAPSWPTVAALLTLHAMADEACVGAGLTSATEFQRMALTILEATGSLSGLPIDRIRVLPKLRPPDSGITLRSISHNLALDRSEVRTTWVRAPNPPSDAQPSAHGRLTLLVVPYPSRVHANDFQPVRGPLLNMDQQRYGFFEFVPTEPIDPEGIVALVDAARPRVGAIDAVILPEAALDEAAVPILQTLLTEAGVPYLVTGVRRSATVAEPFATNYAYIGGAGWHAVQHKHHRWCIDAAQVHQYHLGASLDPNHSWWEAIHIPRRSLTFITTPEPESITICPLVCEDLARPDPVTDVIRATAPTLVIGLLLDGPQLAERWPARYASVLADDPGSSVLTVTSLGMAWRSQPPGHGPSRVIALWKDPHRGLQQIILAEDARAVALTAYPRETRVTSADGRTSPEPIAELVLAGLEQIG